MKRIAVKFLKITGLVFFFLIAGIVVFIFFTGPFLPDGTGQMIDEVLAKDPPSLVTGSSGYVQSGKTRIWYESITPEQKEKGSVLLFMGIANDALGWPRNFLAGLINEGYQVIRFDYRSTGLSDWIDDYELEPFSLADLGNDALLILDSLHLQKVHLVGVSLGGMVAQDFAIHHPERSLTLTSMMSSGNIIDPDLPGISMGTIVKLVKTAVKYNSIKTIKNTIKAHIAFRLILRGKADYKVNTRDVAEEVYYNITQRKGYNFKASEQHQQATFKSGSRYEKLTDLNIPILILHGRQDPLIPFAHGEKLAKVLPRASAKWFDNMGHDIPDIHNEEVIGELVHTFQLNPH